MFQFERLKIRHPQDGVTSENLLLVFWLVQVAFLQRNIT